MVFKQGRTAWDLDVEPREKRAQVGFVIVTILASFVSFVMGLSINFDVLSPGGSQFQEARLAISQNRDNYPELPQVPKGLLEKRVKPRLSRSDRAFINKQYSALERSNRRQMRTLEKMERDITPITCVTFKAFHWQEHAVQCAQIKENVSRQSNHLLRLKNIRNIDPGPRLNQIMRDMNAMRERYLFVESRYCLC